jgi:hypothetical protein
VLRPSGPRRRRSESLRFCPVAATLVDHGWAGPVTEADVDRVVRSLCRNGRNPFAGRRWFHRGVSWVDSWVFVCDGATLTDEAVQSLDADDTYGRPDLSAHGVVGHPIAFSDRGGWVTFTAAPAIGPPDVIRLDADMDDESEEFPDVAVSERLAVASGRLTVVDWAHITDRSQWHTFDVPAGAQFDIYLPSLASPRWCYLGLVEPDGLIERITCRLTTGMLPSPQFTVTFHADGSAEWSGEVQVDPLGDATSNVGPAAFRRLAGLVVEEGILDLGPDSMYISDVPVLTIAVERAGTDVSISRIRKPPAMTRVLEACARAAARAGWTLREGDFDAGLITP